jgi:hypothetical protein
MKLKRTLLTIALFCHLPSYGNTDITCSPADNSAAVKQSPSTLLSCFASPSPTIRDEYAFTEFSRILREGEVSKNELVTMANDIQQLLRSDNIKNYHKAFLTLGLAEIARVDRKTPFLNHTQRQALVESARFLFETTDDFTGFDEKYGYIHQIPHTADLVLQLALNKNITQKQLTALALSLKAAVNPSQIVFYHTNEPDRLARASIYLLLREELNADFVEQWISDVSKPPTSTWADAYQSHKGLAAMHNVTHFLGRLLLVSYGKQNERITLVHELTLARLKNVK